MILVIGGAGQGKLAAALRNTGYTEADVTTTPGADRPVLNGMADAARAALAAGEAQEQTVAKLLRHAVVICDEVGCGVVPMEQFEREWRENVGRICCVIAEKSDVVVRIFCGIPMVLKGEAQWK